MTVFEIEKEERRTRRMLSISLNYLSKGQVPSQPVVRHVLLQKFELHSGVVIKPCAPKETACTFVKNGTSKL